MPILRSALLPALGSPSGRAGAKRLRGITAPILPTSYPQIHCTDSLYETASHYPRSARPLSPSLREVPLPKGRGKGLRGSFKQLDKSKLNAPSIDTHQALGSPSGRAVPKGLRGLTAPIPPTSYPQSRCTNSLYKLHSSTHCLHDPSPPPFGRYLSRRERQGLCANLKQYYKPKF